MPRNRVLLVDDEEGPRFGVRRYLSSHGFDVEEACDCATARTRFRAAPPDVAILDFRLPDGTALDLLPEFCANAGTTPIILTAYASAEMTVEALKLGAKQVLTKPVQLDALLAVIRQLLQGS